MPGKTTRSSNLELLRILCMLLIIGDHLTGQSGIADYTTLPSSFAFCLIGCGSRIACSVFVLIGGWFLCEQPYKTRRPLSLWLSLWLYTVPVTLLCKLSGLDVSWGALRWAAFPASTRQLWFISDYLLLLLCVPLLNRLLRGLSRPAHRGLLAVLAVPLIVYPTLFGENGAVSDTAWMFLYEYLLIAYLRRWPDNRLAHLLQYRAAALGLGLGLPLLNTILRAVLETRGLTDGKAFQYMAYYRTALGALPNLLAALALFYLFKGLDLGTLMNNLLDNAVEATERADERFIQVYIFSKGSIHDGLVIKNSCAISPKAENGELKTTKQNKKTHGVGTKSIRKTLKKYDAVYGWKYDENSKIFETDIVFSKKN